MLRGLSTVRYQAADLDAAKKWYAEVLGVQPYFERPGYAEFRLGDHQHELGLLDAAYAAMLRAPSPSPAPTPPPSASTAQSPAATHPAPAAAMASPAATHPAAVRSSASAQSPSDDALSAAGAGQPDHPAGVVVYWHVDDVDAAYARLLDLGASPHEPPRQFGEGFVGASVVDPFGNILGIMFNQHYLDMLPTGA